MSIIWPRGAALADRLSDLHRLAPDRRARGSTAWAIRIWRSRRAQRCPAQGPDGRRHAGRSWPSAGSTTSWSRRPRGLRQHIVSLFAAIPHQWHDGNEIARYEGFYASVFYSHLAALGLDLVTEDASSHGRLDLRLRFNGRLWLFEFKVVELAPRAPRCSRSRTGYAEKYRAEGLPMHLIGIEFSRQERTLVGFEVETLAP
jgi:hypothetical protein